MQRQVRTYQQYHTRVTGIRYNTNVEPRLAVSGEDSILDQDMIDALMAGEADTLSADDADGGGVAQAVIAEGPEAPGPTGDGGSSGAAEAGGSLSSSADLPEQIRRILQIRVPVIVQLAHRTLPMNEVTQLLHVGSIVEFDKAWDAELDLMVNNKHIGSGKAVKVGEHFGLRVHHVAPIRAKIEAMGKS